MVNCVIISLKCRDNSVNTSIFRHFIENIYVNLMTQRPNNGQNIEKIPFSEVIL